ncbi:MAG: carbohydrate kinase family protein, partial [Candidatus Bathyarchaeia archaeon]
CAGGAVANVVVAASRLGLKTGFIGAVGDDEFGEFLINDFKKERVDISQIKRVKGVATGIAFYSVDKNGERHYVFYRFPGYSDTESALSLRDIRLDYLSRSKTLHFSESMIRREASRKTVFYTVRNCRRLGLTISYDPNVRLRLWGSRGKLLKTQREVLGLVDILLCTIEELMLITGTKQLEYAIRATLRLGVNTIIIRSRDYYRVVTQEIDNSIPSFKVRAVDTSGAGDAFDAGFLAGVVKRLPLEEAVRLGGATAAIKISKAGTRGGLPSMKEVQEFLREK